MAKVLKEMPDKKNCMSKYQSQPWFNGEVWQLTQGVDFLCRVGTLQWSLRKICKKRGLLPRFRSIDDRNFAFQATPQAGQKTAPALPAPAPAASARPASARPAPAPAAPAPAVSEESLAERLYDLIFTEGSLPIDVLAQRLGRPAVEVSTAAKQSGWFHISREEEVAIKKASGAS